EVWGEWSRDIQAVCRTCRSWMQPHLAGPAMFVGWGDSRGPWIPDALSLAGLWGVTTPPGRLLRCPALLRQRPVDRRQPVSLEEVVDPAEGLGPSEPCASRRR